MYRVILKFIAARVAHGELYTGITGRYFDIVAFYHLKEIAIMCDQVASGLDFGRPGYLHASFDASLEVLTLVKTVHD